MRIRRLTAICLIMALYLICLSGCGRKKEADFGDLKGKIEEKQADARSGKDEKQEPDTEDNKTDEDDPKDQVHDDDDTLPEGDFAEEFREGEVENNGGLFVRIRNRVYFRIYGTRALELTTIEKPFIDEANPEAGSRIMYYDLETGKSGELCTVCGRNGLAVTVDGMCLASPDLESTTLIKKDGTVEEHYLDGYPVCISQDGRSLAVFVVNDNGAHVPVIYRDGRRIGSPEDESKEDVFYSAHDFAGNDLIGVISYLDGDNKEVYSYDENGVMTILGNIDSYDMGTYTLSPEIGEVIPAGKGGFITVGYRDGTANSLVAWSLYEFMSGQENSVKKIDSGSVEEKYGYSIPKVIVEGNGKPKLSAHRAGDVYLSEGSYGDLMYNAEDGSDVVAVEDYIYKPDENSQYMSALEGAVYLNGDTIFFVRVNGEHEPGEDAGWRRAYTLDHIDYEGIRLGDSKGITGYHETVDSAGWNKGEIDYDRLIGTWETYSLNVEGEYRLASDEPTGLVDMLTFNEDGSALIWSKDPKSEKRSNERPIHQVKNTESTPDYAYRYETEDEDPMQVSVCYLSHNRLCVYFLYHFDGSSTGWYKIIYNKVKE